jgi:hypothetical protein
MDLIEYSWHSTPALWCATRRSYDGAPDAHCPIGFGKTKEEAAAELIEMEDCCRGDVEHGENNS